MERQPYRRLATASRRRRASRAKQFRANLRFLPRIEKEYGNRPSAETECLELVDLPSWRQ